MNNIKVIVYVLSVLIILQGCVGSSNNSSSDYLDLSVGTISDTSINLSWNSNNSRLKWKNINSHSWIPDNNPNGSLGAGNRFYYSINGLLCNTEYIIKVKWRGRGWRTKNISTKLCSGTSSSTSQPTNENKKCPSFFPVKVGVLSDKVVCQARLVNKIRRRKCTTRRNPGMLWKSNGVEYCLWGKSTYWHARKTK